MPKPKFNDLLGLSLIVWSLSRMVDPKVVAARRYFVPETGHPKRAKPDGADALSIIYQECHSIRREAEVRESRITFGSSALMVGFTTFLLREASPLGGNVRIFATFLLLSIAAVAIWFLHVNGSRLIYGIRIIVNLESALGVYENGRFDNLNGKSLFPQDAKRWGESRSNRVSIWQSMALTILVSTACVWAVQISGSFALNDADQTHLAPELSDN